MSAQITLGSITVYFENQTPGASLGSNGDLCVYQDISGTQFNLYFKNEGTWTALDTEQVLDFGKITMENDQVIAKSSGKLESRLYRLARLFDVDLDNLANGQIIKWDSSQSKWINSAPVLAADFQISQLTGYDGATSEPLLFFKDPTRSNKMLSIETQNILFAESSIGDYDWIQPPDLFDSDSGYVMPYPGTIVRAAGHCEDSDNYDKGIQLFLNDNYQQDVLTMSGNNDDKQINSDLNIDFNAGDKIRLRAGPQGWTLPDSSFVITVKWRIP